MANNYEVITGVVKANFAEVARLERLLRDAAIAQNWAVVERTERRLNNLKAMA